MQKKIREIESKIPTVWKSTRKRTLLKLQKFTVTEKKFVKSTIYLVSSLVKTLLSRNFCQRNVTVNFCNFHTVHSM